MATIYENGVDIVYPEEINPLSEDFIDVRSLALQKIFSEDRIPSEINILKLDAIILLTTALAEVPVEEVNFDEKEKIQINYILKGATIVKGPFVNSKGLIGFMQIFVVDGQTYSEAYWKKTEGDSLKLEQLITPQCEVINADLLNPNSKRKSIQMPGTNMYIPFKRRIEF